MSGAAGTHEGDRERGGGTEPVQAERVDEDERAELIAAEGAVASRDGTSEDVSHEGRR